MDTKKSPELRKDKSNMVIENSMLKAMEKKFKECLAIMEKKEFKYAHKGDSLAKFSKYSSFTGRSQPSYAMDLCLKQIITLYDACETPREVPLAEIKKLTTDIINYMVIIEELWHREG